MRGQKIDVINPPKIPATSKFLFPVSTSLGTTIIDDAIRRFPTLAPPTILNPNRIIERVWNQDNGVLVLFPGRLEGNDTGNWQEGLGLLVLAAIKKNIPLKIIMTWTMGNQVRFSHFVPLENIRGNTRTEITKSLRNFYEDFFPNAYNYPIP